VPLSTPELCDRLLALRSSLTEERWAGTVQSPVLALFNELVVCAKKLEPADPILRSIEPANATVRATTLRTVVDQILIALGA
jgi:hypothetical protein